MKLVLFCCLIATTLAVRFRPYSSESAPWEKIAVSAGMLKPPDFPINYEVPNYGVDQDILNTEANLKSTEKILGKTLHADFDQKSNPDNPREYRNVNANNSIDTDILNAEENMKKVELNMNHSLNLQGLSDDINGVMKVNNSNLNNTEPNMTEPISDMRIRVDNETKVD